MDKYIEAAKDYVDAEKRLNELNGRKREIERSITQASNDRSRASTTLKSSVDRETNIVVFQLTNVTVVVTGNDKTANIQLVTPVTIPEVDHE